MDGQANAEMKNIIGKVATMVAHEASNIDYMSPPRDGSIDELTAEVNKLNEIEQRTSKVVPNEGMTAIKDKKSMYCDALMNTIYEAAIGTRNKPSPPAEVTMQHNPDSETIQEDLGMKVPPETQRALANAPGGQLTSNLFKSFATYANAFRWIPKTDEECLKTHVMHLVTLIGRASDERRKTKEHAKKCAHLPITATIEEYMDGAQILHTVAATSISEKLEMWGMRVVKSSEAGMFEDETPEQQLTRVKQCSQKELLHSKDTLAEFKKIRTTLGATVNSSDENKALCLFEVLIYTTERELHIDSATCAAMSCFIGSATEEAKVKDLEKIRTRLDAFNQRTGRNEGQAAAIFARNDHLIRMKKILDDEEAKKKTSESDDEAEVATFVANDMNRKGDDQRRNEGIETGIEIQGAMTTEGVSRDRGHVQVKTDQSATEETLPQESINEKGNNKGKGEGKGRAKEAAKPRARRSIAAQNQEIINDKGKAPGKTRKSTATKASGKKIPKDKKANGNDDDGDGDDADAKGAAQDAQSSQIDETHDPNAKKERSNFKRTRSTDMDDDFATHATETAMDGKANEKKKHRRGANKNNQSKNNSDKKQNK